MGRKWKRGREEGREERVNKGGGEERETYPTTNRGKHNGSSLGILYARCTHIFARLVPNFACSVGDYRQNFCLGAQRKFVKIALLVGW